MRCGFEAFFLNKGGAIAFETEADMFQGLLTATIKRRGSF